MELDVSFLMQHIKLLFVIAMLAVGVLNLWIWWHLKLWVPKYIHAMAIASSLLAVFFSCIEYASKGSRLGSHMSMIVIFPSIVYFFAGFYGGAAFAERKNKKDGTEQDDEG